MIAAIIMRKYMPGGVELGEVGVVVLVYWYWGGGGGGAGTRPNSKFLQLFSLFGIPGKQGINVEYQCINRSHGIHKFKYSMVSFRDR